MAINATQLQNITAGRLVRATYSTGSDSRAPPSRRISGGTTSVRAICMPKGMMVMPSTFPSGPVPKTSVSPSNPQRRSIEHVGKTREGEHSQDARNDEGEIVDGSAAGSRQGDHFPEISHHEGSPDDGLDQDPGEGAATQHVVISARRPWRSTHRPIGIAARPEISVPQEKAPIIATRVQPRSSSIGTISTERAS